MNAVWYALALISLLVRTTFAAQPGAQAQPTTVPDGTTFLVAGDIAVCGEEADQWTAALLDTQPGTILALGDEAYESGTADEFARCYDPAWGRFKVRTWAVPGNHEYGTRDAEPYFDYFGTQAGPAGTGYYSFDVPNWHVIALNSNCDQVAGGCGAGSPQEQWLQSDLQTHRAACTLAFWHHPRFSSGPHSDTPETQPFWNDLYQAQADLVLVGHDHIYERFAPQTPSGDLDWANGIRQITVGTGGAVHYPISRVAGNSEVRNNETFGVLKLSLRAHNYSWRFLPVVGESFTDAGTADCHADLPQTA